MIGRGHPAQHMGTSVIMALIQDTGYTLWLEFAFLMASFIRDDAALTGRFSDGGDAGRHFAKLTTLHPPQSG